MPLADPLTPIRAASDLDMVDEAAWSFMEQSGWTCTPQLLFAIKQAMIDEYIIRAE
jgi:hypothetical protein